MARLVWSHSSRGISHQDPFYLQVLTWLRIRDHPPAKASAPAAALSCCASSCPRTTSSPPGESPCQISFFSLPSFCIQTLPLAQRTFADHSPMAGTVPSAGDTVAHGTNRALGYLEITLYPFIFWLCPWHAEVPGPGIEPKPQH